MWLVLLLTTTTLLFALPILGALRELRTGGDAKPLEIIQAHAGDIRHFADHFRSMVDREIVDVRLGAGEGITKFCLVNKHGALLLAEDEEKSLVIRRMVVAKDDIVLPDGCSCEREVYSQGKVTTGVDNRLCAILADGDLDIRRGTVVSRWAHARSVRVGPECVLRGRLSAVSDIVMAPSCQFERINAPIVRFAPDDAAHRDTNLRFSLGHGNKVDVTRAATPFVDGRWIVDGDLKLPPESLFRGDLVVHRNLILGDGSHIEGRIKVHGKAWLGEGVNVDGSFVSQGPIIIAVFCRLQGPIVSESEIAIGAGTTIGDPSRPTTVTGHTICVASDVTVHGTVWARKYAKVESQKVPA
jgi:hypothetical protein